MVGKYHIITGDLYGISSRIKEIDPAYFIVRNYKLERFEVHHKEQKGGSLCLVLPYGQLDERTIRRVRKTRSERLKVLTEQAEADNLRLQRQQTAAAVERALKKVYS